MKVPSTQQSNSNLSSQLRSHEKIRRERKGKKREKENKRNQLEIEGKKKNETKVAGKWGRRETKQKTLSFSEKLKFVTEYILQERERERVRKKRQ